MHPIVKLVAQRVALSLLLLFAASALIFIGTQILPGDVAASILGQSATPEALANLRRDLGLNEPAINRYFSWLWSALQGDLGVALTNGRDIAESLGQRLSNTLFLAFWAAIVSVPLAILDEQGLPRYRALKAELSEVRRVNERMRRDVEDLQREVAALRTDPEAIERIARDELGMVRDDEILFQFPN